MKKIFAIFILFMLTAFQGVNAAVVNLMTDGEYQEYINKTGFKLLNDNRVEEHIIFKYSPSDSLRGYAVSDDKAVHIPKGILTYVESEDELAAVIAYQIAYCLNYYENKYSKVNIKVSPKKYEALADKRAVDFLVKSGYSPLALIAMINKMFGSEKFGFFSKHNKTSVRLAMIYEYIVRKYPEKLDDRKFCRNIYYQNFLLTSGKNRELLQNQLRHDPFSSKKIEYR